MIIEALKGIQVRDNLTDVVMAGRLGIHPMSWSRLKNGRSNMDLSTIRNAVKAYPEIIEPVLRELYGENYKEAALPLITKLASREESDGKRCPNCTSGGQGANGEHETAIHQVKSQGVSVNVIDMGWCCWNCGYEWGFEYQAEESNG